MLAPRLTTKTYIASLLLLQAGMFSACNSVPVKIDYLVDAPGINQVVWPALPEVPRYRYSGQLLGETNFVSMDDSKPGLLAGVFHWLLGIDVKSDNPDVLLRPQSGTVAKDRIYVTDIGRHAVFVFDEKLSKMHVWHRANQENDFISPVGIAITSQEQVLVADADIGCIIRLDSDGNPAGSFGCEQLQRPTGIAYDSETSKIYVSDTSANNIKVFTDTGELVTTFGKKGNQPGEFNGPTHLSFSNNKLAVSDTLNARVQIFSPDGKLLQVTGQRGLYVGELIRPKGVAMDDDGNLYVIEGYYDHMLVFNNKNNLLLPIGGTGSSVGKFFLPSGVWIDSKNRVFVADMFNSRVIIFQYMGL